MSNLTVFQFESKEVRFIGTAIDPWWVAADVCAVLDIRNSRDAIARLDEDEKGVGTIDTPGGNQAMTIINESRLYCLIFTSRKPQAKRFKKWVTSVVLPAIRKTGSFASSPTEQAALPPAPPTPQEISELFDLTLGQSGLDPKLVAGVKLSAIANYYPALKSATETAKSFLGVELESELVTPTQLGKILSDRTGDSWSAQRVNKTLIDQGFQQVNPPGDPDYLPTEKGKEYSKILVNTAKGHGRTVQHLRWFKSVLEALEANDHSRG
jgi:prophage antirepressor-like protein